VRERVVGRLVTRVRPAAGDAITLELAGERHELWLDAGPATAGVYLLTRAERRAIPADDAPGGGSAQAMLHLRKRLAGARLLALERVPGERALVLKAGGATLALRLWGRAPALTLAVDDAPLATLGAGPPAWPPPPPGPEREPPAAAPRPTLLVPAALDALRDADLAEPKALRLLSSAPAAPEGVVLHPASWREAAASFLRLRRRGDRFRARRAALADQARREARRLQTLAEHLARDLEGLPAADALRHQAEALLATPAAAAANSSEVDVADPYDAGRSVRVRIDPRLSLPANADRLFEKARRMERARRQVEARTASTQDALQAARAREARVASARDLGDLDAAAGPRREAPAPERSQGGARHYLTGRGLSVLVGRGARENHRLTFAVAGPEDLWLHARDVPGAHVILRDPEGRAGAEDVREAAEVAAFFSDARTQAQADVHVTRRKHVRSARGGHGRVRVAHSDTLRVAPRDPEGRLRRRL
jgi:predicted ribosome quality control (RQC) complex YloA/Tae2 family protein